MRDPVRQSPGAVLALALLLLLPWTAMAQADSPRDDPASHGALAAGGFFGAGLIVWAERDDGLACNWCGVGPNGTPDVPRIDGWARSRWRWDNQGRAATMSHLAASAAYAWPLVALTAVHRGTGGEWGRDQLAAVSSLGMVQLAADVTKRAFRRARPGVVFDGQPVSAPSEARRLVGLGPAVRVTATRSTPVTLQVGAGGRSLGLVGTVGLE
jgi:hypothetical protein